MRINQQKYSSLDFAVNRVLMKLFKTSNTEIVNQCRHFFGIELPSVQLVKPFEKCSCNVSLLVDCVKQLYVCYFFIYFVYFSIFPSVCLMSVYLCCCSSFCWLATRNVWIDSRNCWHATSLGWQRDYNVVVRIENDFYASCSLCSTLIVDPSTSNVISN